MKTRIHDSNGSVQRAIPGVLFLAMLVLVAPGMAQNFNAGSDGSLGDVVIETNTSMALPSDGILHFKTLQVNSGITLSFARNARNTPVHILSQGDVVVNGTISVDGFDRTVNTGGAGGPGGFEGGKPGFGSEVPGGDGYGPGGGFFGRANTCSSPDDPTSGSYGSLGFGAANGIYGSALIIPLVGGSGGGGGLVNNLSGGGGGGGAVLIASNTRIVINGSVTAIGGSGGLCNNAGSGGAIRLVSFKVEGAGALNAIGGGTSNRGRGAGGLGRVRVDTVIRNNLNLGITGVSSIGGNLLVFPPTVPSLTVTEAAGNLVPDGSGPLTFTLPFGSSTNRTIKIRANGFGRNVPIRVTLTPDSGPKQIFEAEVDNTTVNPAVVTVPVVVPVNTLVTVHCWTR